ncbi:MAG: hypothetical protein R2798_09415 [Chitinophagales bacterium]|nr:hypothetical protein [Chitinophagales bacterium]
MNLKILSKNYSILLLSSITLFLSSCNWCSEKELQVLKATEKGDVEALKIYLENGGDPSLCCWSREGRMGTQYDLISAVVKSNSYELLEIYLDYSISSKDLNNLLSGFLWNDANDSIIELLLKKGAKANSFEENCSTIDYVSVIFDRLEKNNYDFNYQDPKTGNTLLMEYCLCPAPNDAKELVETIAYLIKLGAKTDIKNKEGKTAKDLAVNEKVRDFFEEMKKE